MMLDSIKPIRYNGSEIIIDNKKGHKLLNFWQWAYSDLIGNTERGNFAEYLVALACEVENSIRVSWNPYDIELKNGIKIEVKSSAYLQSWKQKVFSKPIFSIRKSLAWDSIENIFEIEKKRQADVYVFALLAHKDKATLNPLYTNQWEFYILNTKILNDNIGENKSVSLSRIIRLKAIKSSFNDLLDNINIAYAND
jgi:hypothetical protein